MAKPKTPPKPVFTQLVPRAFTVEDDKGAGLFGYAGKITSVVDGDTLKVIIDQGVCNYATIILRLKGLNAPEKKYAVGQTVLRDLEALVAAARTLNKHDTPDAPNAYNCFVQTKSQDNRNRWESILWVVVPTSHEATKVKHLKYPVVDRQTGKGFAVINVNNWLLATGRAAEYTGGKVAL